MREQAALGASTGVSIPFCEAVFVPELPVTVAKVTAPQGLDAAASEANQGAMTASAGWATVSPGALVLRGTLTTVEMTLVKEGAKAVFRSDSATEDHVGSVTTVTAEGFIVTPEMPLTEEQRGQNMRVSIMVEATSAEVLAVPLAAVSGTADGHARVTKMTPSGETVDIPVRPGLAAEGLVEVVATVEGDLREGDSVVVGR